MNDKVAKRGIYVQKRSLLVVSFFLLISAGIVKCVLITNEVEERGKQQEMHSNHIVEDVAEVRVANIPKIELPPGGDWREFEGTVLNMITENTPPSLYLAAHIDSFENLTGIKVNIEPSDLRTVIERAGLDFNAKSANYHIIYADPYQILAKYPDHFVNLNELNGNPMLPHIPGGLEDFMQTHLEVTGYVNDKSRLLALPFDSSTMLLVYRKDVFEKYKSEFQAEHGYDWTPGPNLSWEQYYEIASWINKKVGDGTITEVKYGIGHQAKRDDSLMNDFSNILVANGGDYFDHVISNNKGVMIPTNSGMNSDIALQSIKFYKELINIAAPGSTSWDWSDLAAAFAKGELAMAPEWHDFAYAFEDESRSNVAGKVGWANLPKGKERHAHMFGGTGLAINKYASDQEIKAAWLFLIWATSPQTQYMLLKTEQGWTPTRHSIYNLPEVQAGMQAGTPESKEMISFLPMAEMLTAWEEENMYIRPKFLHWQQVNTFIFTELSKMLMDKQSPEKTAEKIAKKSNDSIKGED